MANAGDDSPSRPSLQVGQRVEVRTGFDRSWAPGFVVDEVEEVGYRLRRSSDGSVLPAVFPHEDVRRERKNSMWWI